MNIPESKVLVKVSLCPTCMTTKTKNSFAKEAMEHNLSIKEITLTEYRTAKWCECK